MAGSWISAAREYRRLMETAAPTSRDWIEAAWRALSALYAAATDPSDSDSGGEPQAVTPTTTRAEIERRLGALPRPLTGYWVYSDGGVAPDAENQPVLGSTADGLLDVYDDVGELLANVEAAAPDERADAVREGLDPLFGVHWGHHALELIRVFHDALLLRPEFLATRAG